MTKPPASVEAFELNPAKVEAVIIHEALHSLGLGENPPRSQDITSQVMSRCFLWGIKALDARRPHPAKAFR